MSPKKMAALVAAIIIILSIGVNACSFFTSNEVEVSSSCFVNGTYDDDIPGCPDLHGRKPKRKKVSSNSTSTSNKSTSKKSGGRKK